MLKLMGRVERWLKNEPAPPAIPPPKAKPAASSTGHFVVQLIDCSSSMSEEDFDPSRMAAAQQASISFAKTLSAQDPSARIAVVGYDDRASVACNWVSVCDLRAIEAAIQKLRPRGSTNIAAGLDAARQLLSNVPKHRGQVIVLSDGEHNALSNPRRAADALRKLAVIECVGIGGTPDAVDTKLMKYIASARPDGSKRYRWIGDGALLIEHYQQLAGRIMR